jgi:hypothetical protein
LPWSSIPVPHRRAAFAGGCRSATLRTDGESALLKARLGLFNPEPDDGRPSLQVGIETLGRGADEGLEGQRSVTVQRALSMIEPPSGVRL